MKLEWFKHDLANSDPENLAQNIEEFISNKIKEGWMPVHCAEKPKGVYLFREMTVSERKNLLKDKKCSVA